MSLITYLTKAESITLSGTDIVKITDGEALPMSYDQLETIDNINDLFIGKNAVIILYEVESATEGHWTALIKHSDKLLEFFDSYGFAPDQEIKYSPYYLREYGGKTVPHLTALLNASDYKVIHNTISFQQNRNDVNTCGRHCSLRVRLRDIPLKKYQNMILNNSYGNPDIWVTALTILYSL